VGGGTTFSISRRVLLALYGVPSFGLGGRVDGDGGGQTVLGSNGSNSLRPMWADDEQWMPRLLAGEKFRGWFEFDGDRMEWSKMEKA